MEYNDLSRLLEHASKGNLPEYQWCPRNPKNNKSVGFSQSCKKHHAKNKALIMCIARDPAGSKSGSVETAVNCFICNKDRTAKNVNRLFYKYIAIHGVTPKDWYATNAVMHGFHDDNIEPNPLTYKHCSIVLKKQIQILSPLLVIAFGEDSAKSLKKIYPFDEKLNPRSFKEIYKDGNNLRKPRKWINESYIVVLPHPGKLGTNNAGGPQVVERLWKQLGEWLNDQKSF